ncbi:hypothetical protein L2E82_38248 [Cichorium intybus]|uniref:Uncharacterized protein n=1 Tax=Cichorium intybus TaxID=13427 RepID=A0ACB9AEZ0_CICIN|nr:hypothetical protein L2E82_38248 [Cichorium intybus]
MVLRFCKSQFISSSVKISASRRLSPWKIDLKYYFNALLDASLNASTSPDCGFLCYVNFVYSSINITSHQQQDILGILRRGHLSAYWLRLRLIVQTFILPDFYVKSVSKHCFSLAGSVLELLEIIQLRSPDTTMKHSELQEGYPPWNIISMRRGHLSAYWLRLRLIVQTFILPDFYVKSLMGRKVKDLTGASISTNKKQQQEYESEGIEWKKVEFVDNQGCLDLFEKKTGGLLSTLDEASSTL